MGFKLMSRTCRVWFILSISLILVAPVVTITVNKGKEDVYNNLAVNAIATVGLHNTSMHAL